MDRSHGALYPQVKAVSRDGVRYESELVKILPETILFIRRQVTTDSWLTKNQHSVSEPEV